MRGKKPSFEAVVKTPHLWSRVKRSDLEDFAVELCLRYAAYSDHDSPLVASFDAMYDRLMHDLSPHERSTIIDQVCQFLQVGVDALNTLALFVHTEPDPHVAATAVINMAHLAPLVNDDSLSGLTFLTSLYEHERTPERMRASIFSGILLLGDRRLLPLLHRLWDMLKPESKVRASHATSGIVHASTVDFLLARLEDEPDEGIFGLLAAALYRLPAETEAGPRPGYILDVERRFPSSLLDTEPTVTLLDEWTIAEYGARIALRLRRIAEKENEPRILPMVMAAWGIDNDDALGGGTVDDVPGGITKMASSVQHLASSHEFIVSPQGDGTHLTIAAALADASAGSRIVVHPGTYTLPLVIDVPVEIAGTGRPEDVVLLAADGSCVSAQASEATLRNLTIINGGFEENQAHAAVRVNKGHLRLEECLIGSQHCGGVEVSGGDALLTAVRCRLSQIVDSAVQVSQRARATLEDCVIEQANTGATIRQGGRLTMTRCTIRKCDNAGLSFYEYGSGTIEDCILENLGAMGIGILQGSDPVIRRCTVRNGRMNGIGVLMHGLPLIEDCVISGHGMEAVVIRSAGNPTMRRCAIADSTHFGVGIYEQGQGLFEDCEITGHMYGGVMLEDAETTPTLRRCHLHHNDNFGLSADKGAQGVVEDCTVEATHGLGVYIAGGADPLIKATAITSGDDTGVLVTAWGRGRIEDCDVRGNTGAGILISDEATPMIRGGRIRENRDAGVWVDQHGRGTVEDCAITANVQPGIRVTRGGDPLLRRCRVHDGHGGGIVIVDGGRGQVEDCEQIDNAPVQEPQDADAVLARIDERRRAEGAYEHIVFCERPRAQQGEGTYGAFVTDDDVRLLALAGAVEDGTLSSNEACDTWAEIFGTPLEDHVTGGGKQFPRASDFFTEDLLPARAEFFAAIAELSLPGVSIAAERTGPTAINAMQVNGEDALARLREALKGQYKLVVWPDTSYLAERNLVDANRLILRASRLPG